MEYSQLLADYNDILLPEDVQKILHTGRNTVYQYLAQGKIRSPRIGGKYKIPKLYLLLYSIHEKTHKFVTKFVTYKKRHES